MPSTTNWEPLVVAKPAGAARVAEEETASSSETRARTSVCGDFDSATAATETYKHVVIVRRNDRMMSRKKTVCDVTT